MSVFTSPALLVPGVAALLIHDSGLFYRSLAASFSVTFPQVAAFTSSYRICRPGTYNSYQLRDHLRVSSSSSSVGTRFSDGKNREDELSRLAASMQVSVPKLKGLLSKKRGKIKTGTEKASYIDWLLNNGSSGVGESAATVKSAFAKVGDTDLRGGASPQLEKSTPTRRIRPKRPEVLITRQKERQAEAQTRHAAALQDPTLLTSVKFADRDDLHPASKRAVAEVMGLKTMTEIQARTYAAALTGEDVLGRARTGTGKTLAFLLPAIERVLQSGEYRSGLNVGCLIISPTRELATQIGDQAQMLLSYHNDLSVQVVYGGTKMQRDVNTLSRALPTILVATPGRLLDHLESTRVNGRKFVDIMSETRILVLDETDRLLDMGFQREIRRIISFLPRREKRQTLLFSATIPVELRSVMAETMKSSFVEVDCINEADGTTHTNAQVQQSHVVLPSMDRYVMSVVEIVTGAMSEEGGSKIVVFFPATKMVAFFANLFNYGLGIAVIELHSRKTQSARNRASDTFRKAKSSVLFTSDVSARGVDYPGVTHVIQFGAPESREQYIHRLGRTGRAGESGKGVLVLAPFESIFLAELKGHDVPKDADLEQLLNIPVSADIHDLVRPALDRIRSGDAKLTPSAEGAYQAFLGYYLSQVKRLKIKSKEDVVHVANQLSTASGLRETPELSKRLVSKMGLNGVSGVVVASTIGSKGTSEAGSKRGHADGRRAPPYRKKRRS